MAGENYGVQFIIIAVGDTNLRCEDEDADAVKEAIDPAVAPFKTTIVRGRTADKFMVALLQEQGAL